MLRNPQSGRGLSAGDSGRGHSSPRLPVAWERTPVRKGLMRSRPICWPRPLDQAAHGHNEEHNRNLELPEMRGAWGGRGKV